MSTFLRNTPLSPSCGVEKNCNSKTAFYRDVKVDIRTLSLLPTAEEQMYHKNEDDLVKDGLEKTHHVQTEVKTKEINPLK